MKTRAVILWCAGVLWIAGSAVAESRLSFDGADDRVTVPYDTSFPTEVFTIGAWVKLSPPSGRAAIIARGEDDNSFNLSWQLYVHQDGSLEIMLEDDRENNHCYPRDCMGQPRASCVSGDLFIADDAWHHVAATRDASGTVSLFVDGASRMTCPDSGVPSSNNFQDLTIGCTHGQIGPLPPGGTEPPIWFFPGLIDEPAMWSVALSGSQIQDVFANGVSPSQAGLAGYWNFEEGSGQLVADSSPAGNDGFLGTSNGADAADPTWDGDPTPPPPPPTIPAAPSDLSATATSVSTIDLEWSDNSVDEESFLIDRRPVGGIFSRIATVSADVVTFTDTGLAADSTFEYQVIASSSAGDSQPSNLAGATTPAPVDCDESTQTLCLAQERFRVEVEWRDFQDVVGAGQIVLSSLDSGLFWFFDPDNWEMMIKVLDGCGFNDHFWVFASATTNVEYTLRVTDTQTGVMKEYFNPLGNAAPAITDTGAFATCP